MTHHRPGLACEMAENIDNPFGLQTNQYQVIFAARALRPVLHAKSTPSVGQRYLAFARSTQVLPGQDPSPPSLLPNPSVLTRENYSHASPARREIKFVRSRPNLGLAGYKTGAVNDPSVEALMAAHLNAGIILMVTDSVAIGMSVIRSPRPLSPRP